MLKSSNPKDRIGITKVPLHLIPLPAQIVASLAHLDGAIKYGPYNWRKEKVAATIYIDAALRHIQKWLNGQEMDADNGAVHNLGHAIACLNILIDAQHYGNLIDDRPPADASPLQLDEMQAVVKKLLERHGKQVPSTPPIANDHLDAYYEDLGIRPPTHWSQI